MFQTSLPMIHVPFPLSSRKPCCLAREVPAKSKLSAIVEHFILCKRQHRCTGNITNPRCPFYRWLNYLLQLTIRDIFPRNPRRTNRHRDDDQGRLKRAVAIRGKSSSCFDAFIHLLPRSQICTFECRIVQMLSVL